jgi:hypothetical protein
MGRMIFKLADSKSADYVLAGQFVEQALNTKTYYQAWATLGFISLAQGNIKSAKKI